jgi:hypothetical protein
MTILDWRSSADYSQLTRRANSGTAKALFDAKGRVVMREPARVDGICWHITACIFGVSPAAVARHGGDRRRARNERARRIPAHATLFRDGDAAVPFGLLAHLYHGNGWNPTKLGIEIESADGTITPEQIATCGELVPWLIAEAAREGAELSSSCAHRSSNGIKPNDPGPIVWRELVIPLSERHGLRRIIDPVPPSTRTVRQGLPIPKSWDPLGT